MQYKEDFQSLFSALISSTTTTFYFYCGILFLPQISHLMLFLFYPFNLFPFSSFFLTLARYFSKLNSAASVLTMASLLCVAYFYRLHILLLHTVLNTYQTTSSTTSWYIEPVYTQPWVESLIYGDEFSSLPIHFLKFFFCP